MIHILLIIPIPFFLLEIYRRGNLVFLAEEIRAIARIFMLVDNDVFNREIHKFVLRDFRLRPGNLPKELWKWLTYFLLGFVDLNATLWYVGIMAAAIIAHQFFLTRP